MNNGSASSARKQSCSNRRMVSLEEGHGSRQAEGHNLQPRGQNQVGFICSSIRNAFPDVEFMNGKQEDPVTPIVSFMLEAHAGARQEH